MSKSKQTKHTPKQQPNGKRYSIDSVTYVMLAQLAKQDAASGKRPRSNMAATLYEVLSAELQRRKSPGAQEESVK